MVAIYFVYKAFVEVGLRKPYALLFRSEELQRQQAELAHAARLSMLGETAASLAHELNQPLHAVKNYAYGSICRLQAMPHKDEETRRRAGADRRRGQSRSGDHSPGQSLRPKSANGGSSPSPSMASLRKRCSSPGRTSSGTAPSSSSSLPKNLPSVAGDSVQIQQVLLNLVRNGMEAMEQSPDGDRLLRIATTPCGADTVQIEVCDSGAGIKPTDLEQVFEPFFTHQARRDGHGAGHQPVDRAGPRRAAVGDVEPNPRMHVSFHLARRKHYRTKHYRVDSESDSFRGGRRRRRLALLCWLIQQSGLPVRAFRSGGSSSKPFAATIRAAWCWTCGCPTWAGWTFSNGF